MCDILSTINERVYYLIKKVEFRLIVFIAIKSIKKKKLTKITHSFRKIGENVRQVKKVENLGTACGQPLLLIVDKNCANSKHS